MNLFRDDSNRLAIYLLIIKTQMWVDLICDGVTLTLVNEMEQNIV